MSKQLIECIPNISEGKDLNIIQKITNEITISEGVTLIDVDSGKATNRTVITFVGDPQSVIQAAFKLIKKSAELIDMTKHSGEHPRMGSTDVCPLVPISGITMSETVVYSKRLAEMVGHELNIPVYLYEEAATLGYRKNLADVRSGEYEGLKSKLTQKEWKPDFGSSNYNEFKNSGATAIGARDFLIAYNINLNTTSTRRANAIAFDIREKGRILREGGKLNGKILKTKNGDTIWEPGSLKHVKAIGWYIEEYGITQISMNLTNIKETPIHIVFDEVCKKANERGIRVTGSELVGLIPLQSMIDAGEYFLNKQQRSLGIAESEIIKIAQKTMGLDEIQPFKPKEKIIEYVIDNNNHPLCKMSLSSFLQETASESPAPGGGSISAYIGSLGAALTTMVANLSSHKRGWDEQWEEFSKMAQTGQEHINILEELVDEDTRAFNDIMNAFRLKSQTEKEKKIKEIAIQEATINAINIPLKIMSNSLELLNLIEQLVIHGNPNSVSDVGVAALCARSAVLGGYLNVLINAKDLTDINIKDKLIKEAEYIREKTIKQENKIIDLTLKTIQNSP